MLCKATYHQIAELLKQKGLIDKFAPGYLLLREAFDRKADHTDRDINVRRPLHDNFRTSRTPTNQSTNPAARDQSKRSGAISARPQSGEKRTSNARIEPFRF
jgi:hypothetical protein